MRGKTPVLLGLVGLVTLVPLTNGGGFFLDSRILIYGVWISLAFAWFLSVFLQERSSAMVTGAAPGLQGRLEIRPVGGERLWVLLLVVGAVSLVSMSDFFAGLDRLMLLAVYGVAFYLTASLCRDEWGREAVGTGLMVSSLALALYGVYQYTTDLEAVRDYLSRADMGIAPPERIFATFTSPNLLAGYMLLIVPLSIGYAVYGKRWWSRTVGLLSALLGVTALVLTFSRGAYIAALVGLVLTGFLLARLRGEGIPGRTIVMGTLVGVGVLVTLAAVSWLASGNTFAYTGLVGGAVSSMEGRLDFWRGAFEMIARSPWLGMGLGSFATALPAFQEGSSYSRYAHNVYLQAFAETGLVGGVVFVSLLSTVVCVVLRRVMSQADRIGVAAAVGGIAWLIQNGVDYGYYIPVAGLGFWTLMGLAVAGRDTSGPEVTGREASGLKVADPDAVGPKAAGRMAALGLVGTAVVIGLLVSAYSAELAAQSALEMASSRQAQGALGEMRAAVARNPFSAEYRSRLSDLDEVLSGGRDVGLRQESLAAAQAAVALRRRWPYYHARLGQLYLSRGDKAQGVGELKIAYRLYPNEPLFAVLVAEQAMGESRLDVAEIWIEKALSTKRYYESWLGGGKPASGIDKYSQGTLSNLARAYSGLGELRFRQSRWADALEGYGLALALDPNAAPAYLGRGKVFLKLGRTADGKRDLAKAVELDPNNPTYRLELARHLERTGDLRGARAEYRLLADANPEDLEVRKALARVEGEAIH